MLPLEDDPMAQAASPLAEPRHASPPPVPGVLVRARTLTLSALEQLAEGDHAAPSYPALRSHLETAADALQKAHEGRDVAGNLAEAMRRMGETLAVAREDAHLLGAACRAMELVAEAMAMLYPLLADHGIAQPPPIPWRRPRPAVTGAERRRFQRVTFEAEVNFHSDHNLFLGFSEDISEGGLFAATYDIKPLGTRVELTFGLPCGHVVQCEGEVRWVRQPSEDPDAPPPGMGVRFLDLSEADRQVLRRYIDQRAPIFYDDED